MDDTAPVIAISGASHKPVIRLRGEIDFVHISDLSVALEHATVSRPDLLTIDLSLVKFISVQGIVAIGLAQRRAGTTVLRGAKPIVLRVLDSCGFLTNIVVEEDRVARVVPTESKSGMTHRNQPNQEKQTSACNTRARTA
jgi:anti-anti-sigma factor